MTASELLTQAGKTYGACAKIVAAKCVPLGQPNAIQSEQLIAFGIASDWCRRAAAMKPLLYQGKLMNKSNRSPGVSEMLRFTLAWSGMNSLFARNSVVSLFGGGPIPSSELERFKIVYSHAGLVSVDVTALTTTLHSVLKKPVDTVLPGDAPGRSPITLEVLHRKYTPVHVQSLSTGKKVRTAFTTGNLAALDLPTLIYLMRNWSVHGGLVDSSFRSVARFRTYIDTILMALALTHDGLATELQKRV